MNVITNLLVLLIVTSFILPASAIMYASGSSENNGDSSGGSTDNGDSSSGSTDNGDDSSSGSTENNAASGSGSTENNTAPPSGSKIEGNNTGGNNTGTAQAHFDNDILEVHNSERAAVGVPDLVWSKTLAADAQTWADHLATTGVYARASEVDRKGEGENLERTKDSCPPACKGPYSFPSAKDLLANWTNEKFDYQQWLNGIPVSAIQGFHGFGHYTQMVWRDTKEVGCAMTNTQTAQEYTGYLVCRYSPAGNTGNPTLAYGASKSPTKTGNEMGEQGMGQPNTGNNGMGQGGG